MERQLTRVEPWSLKGALLGACNCNWGCPCNFDATPTGGYCQGVGAWIIAQGHYGQTRLDGLTLVFAAAWPGAIHEGNGTVVHIVDERADAQQRAAFETLTAGNGVGLPFDIFAAVTSRRLPTLYAPIEVKLAGIRSELRVAGGSLYEMALTRVKNPVTGAEEELYLDKPTGFTSLRSELGMSTVMHLAAGELAFDHPGQYADYAEFEYAGP